MASPCQVFGGHALLALILALMLVLNQTQGDELPDPEARPFVTSPDLLAVTVIFPTDSPPQIMEITPLNAGRLTFSQGGPFELQTLNSAGDIISRLAFQVVFEPPGLHGHTLDEVPALFVVPGRHTESIVVSGPTGSDRRQIKE